MSDDARIQAYLDAERVRLARLTDEAAICALERIADERGTPPTDEERAKFHRCAARAAERATDESLVHLSIRSDDRIRGELIDKLMPTAREILS